MRPILKYCRVFLIVFVLGTLSACAAQYGEVNVHRTIPALNVDDGVAVKGYDPVAYFTLGTPTEGSDNYTAEYQGATYKFASAENKKLFQANPDKYAPQYGGYCAYAISRGDIADVDPDEWAIVDNKLYLNNNFLAMHLWDEDRPNNIVAGQKNWPLVKKMPLQK